MSSTTGISRSVLTEQLARANENAEGIAREFKVDEKGRFEISKEQHQKYVSAVREGQEVKQLLDAYDASNEMSEFLNQPAGTPEAAQGFGRQASMEAKSLGDEFVSSDAYQRAAEGQFREARPIRMELEGKSLFTMSAGDLGNSGGPVPALGSKQDLGIHELARRKFHIRDLFPKSTTRANILYAVRETGWTNNAAQVKERYAADGVSAATGADTDVYGRAPKSKLHLANVVIPVAEVAHTLDAHKNILSDEPRLKTFINTRMIEGVKYREDFDLLHSVGDGERLTGLFNTPGVQQYPGLASDKYDVQVRRAITKALLAEYEPSGLVLSPTMFEAIEVEEGNDGHLRVAVSVAIGAQKTIWRLNVVETTAMADENFLVGAFGMGAQLHDRETVSVTVSSENSDNFERGVVTFRADERVALEVPRPESFVIGTWTTPA